MSVFEIDEQGGKALSQRVADNPLDLSKVTPGMFSGFFSAAGGGIMQGGSRTFTTAALALSPAVGGRDDYLNSFRSPDTQQLVRSLGMKPDTSAPTTAGQDWYFENVVEDLGQRATEYWAPDPAQTGTAGRIAGGLMQIAVPLALGGGNPSILAANEGIEAPAGLVKQGAGAGTATTFGAVSAGATMLGFKIPASFGSTALQRVGSGAVANLVVGTATAAAQQGVLVAGGSDQLAKAYDPMNLEARAVDVLTGAVFGGIAHLQAGDRDAVLTVSNAKHMQVDTAPGIPADEASSGAHQNALASAINSVLRGEQVSVAGAIDAAEFLPVRRTGIPAERAANYDMGPARYEAYRRVLESGGDPNAKNGASTATGIDQFTAGTWRRIVAQAKPDWAQGLNDNQLLAARRDPVKSGQMARALDEQNTAALEAGGVDATAHNLYAAHHFGAERGLEFARAADDTPMSRILSKAQMDANPYLKGKTKSDAIANWDERARRAGIDVPETVRMVRPEVATGLAAENPPMVPTTPAEAAKIVDQRLSTLDDLAQRDRLSPEEVAAYREEDAALVEVIRRQEQLQRDNVLPADPRERITAEDFDALTARRVEIRQAIERSNNAKGYETVAQQLRSRLDRIDADSDLVAFADRISGRDQLVRGARTALPETGATPPMETARRPRAGGQRVAPGPDWMTPGALDVEAAGSRAGLAQADAPAIPASRDAPTAAARQQQPAGSQDSADVAQQAAVEAVAANPDLQITLEDGTVVTAADALARAEADIAQAEIDSRGFAAAVACSLRFA
ncbi:hypothetical protein U4I37_19915 [Stenotrophomonas maltophilia]|uniref:hypothetical protein n=1 Tax=Stenotrophomonas maltophilia TaxID=40324 RepID=UPI002ACC4918|nr:hypothetical protein [Stenotrophomonas maltophilia]MDZ5788508.1 hypothetical protein [Stenotrophomonas maltophilia]